MIFVICVYSSHSRLLFSSLSYILLHALQAQVVWKEEHAIAHYKQHSAPAELWSFSPADGNHLNLRVAPHLDAAATGHALASGLQDAHCVCFQLLTSRARTDHTLWLDCCQRNWRSFCRHNMKHEKELGSNSATFAHGWFLDDWSCLATSLQDSKNGSHKSHLLNPHQVNSWWDFGYFTASYENSKFEGLPPRLDITCWCFFF